MRSPSDPILKEDGTLILRIRETKDQTLNVLTATEVAIPQVICPTLRSNLETQVNYAIDLTLLRKLAERLGKHAGPVFQQYFLRPAEEENGTVATLFSKLVEIDKNGTFVPIFLEELNLLGETLFADGDTSDKTGAIANFLDYLLMEARRGIHEFIPLEYFSEEFRVGIILLAITEKTRTLGVTPYLNRLDEKIKLGCDSIYVIAYPPAFRFLSRFLDTVEGDDRVSCVKRVKTNVQADLLPGVDVKKIAMLRRNPLFADTTFDEKVKTSGLAVGDVVEGMVVDVSKNTAIVDVRGINAMIRVSECSWITIKDCTEILKVRNTDKFVVKSIDSSRSMLELTKRFPEEDPWRSEKIPEVGEIVEVTFHSCDGFAYRALFIGNIEILIHHQELSWTEAPNLESADLIGSIQKVRIIEKSDQNRILKGSIRHLLEDPWPEIHRKLPKGTRLRGTVIEINPDFVRLKLPDGLQGIVPKEAMVRGGFEYADYKNTIVLGQKLDVVVTKVFLKKRKIRLDLQRNIEKEENQQVN